MSQTDMESGRKVAPGTPRWVKVFGVIFIVLALLFGILHLTGNSLGSPGSHGMPMQPGTQQP